MSRGRVPETAELMAFYDSCWWILEFGVLHRVMDLSGKAFGGSTGAQKEEGISGKKHPGRQS